MKRAATLAKPGMQVLLILMAMGLMQSPAAADGNDNPGVLPPHATAGGRTYGEWSAEWWKWIISIPADQNPGLDETGELAGVGQEGPVWFLPGLFGSGEVTRTITVPAGKALFFPLYNWVWWAPDDLETAAFVADHLGFTADEIAAMTDEELIRLLANYAAGEPELTCAVDGRPLENLLQYHAESPAFELVDTDLLEDLGAPISHPNLAVASGYWIMLAPMPVGQHTIQWTVDAEHSIPDFDTELDVTFQINVVPR